MMEAIDRKMTKKAVVLRIREKLTKLHVYNTEAHKLYGPEIAREMFQADLDFYATLLSLIGPTEE